MRHGLRLLKRLLCRHEYRWVRNIFGDEIIARGYRRSVWECVKCGRYLLRKHLGG